DTGRFALSVDSMPLEEWTALLDRYHRAKLAYSSAVCARIDFQKFKLENSKWRVKSHDRHALESAMWAADDHYDMIADMMPEFATERELTDANAALILATHAYETAKIKFEDAARAD